MQTKSPKKGDSFNSVIAFCGIEAVFILLIGFSAFLFLGAFIPPEKLRAAMELLLYIVGILLAYALSMARLFLNEMS